MCNKGDLQELNTIAETWQANAKTNDYPLPLWENNCPADSKTRPTYRNRLPLIYSAGYLPKTVAWIMFVKNWNTTERSFSQELPA